MATTRVVPGELAILPVRDTVLFPGAVMPLPVGRESSLALLESLEGPEKLLGVVAQLDPRVEIPTGSDLHGVGTLAKVHKMVRMPNGNVVAFLEGLERIRVLEVTGLKPFLRARIEAQPDLENQRDAELTALERNVLELFKEVVARSPQLSDDLQTEARISMRRSGWPTLSPQLCRRSTPCSGRNCLRPSAFASVWKL